MRKKQKVPMVGLFVAIIIALFIMSTFTALLIHAPTWSVASIWQEPYYRHVTLFSFYQASLSTLISVGLAIPVAHALSRRRFFAKLLLLRLFSATLVLPVLVGVFGLVAIFGNRGILASVSESLGGSFPFSIYGLSGILLAHVFFNLPYASRLLLQSLETLPEEQHKLCAHLGMGHWNKFRLVEWPRMKQQLPHVSGLVFMLCFTSFATVMALGGGPKSTTIELAIYQAIKFDFDLSSGALLAIWQMVLCGLLSLLLLRLTKPVPMPVQSGVSERYLIKDSLRARVWDGFWIILVVLLVIPPLLMVCFSGINQQLPRILLSASFWSAFKTSLMIALLAATLALSMGCFILITSRAWRMTMTGDSRKADGIELVGSIILVTPGLVISVGLFLLLRQFFSGIPFGFPIVVIVNSLMALPYVIKTLTQPMLHIARQYQSLCLSLGMTGWRRCILVEWRALRAPISQAFAISFMLSIGDLSAIALFGDQDFKTLPLYLYQLLGSYQTDAAAVVALCLLVLSLGCFTLVNKVFRSREC